MAVTRAASLAEDLVQRFRDQIETGDPVAAQPHIEKSIVRYRTLKESRQGAAESRDTGGRIWGRPEIS